MIIVLSVAVVAIVIGAVVVLQKGTSNSKTSPAGSPAVTASKLESTDVVVGTGATVKVGDSITVKYTGSLVDGTVFDSTAKQGGTPATFTLAKGQLIEGWVQGIPGMKVGGTRKLVIPPELGYGAQANGSIPANATLLFTIELVSIN
jgi:FKBP-type peptidyl-prolyl cis-trans isomerase